MSSNTRYNIGGDFLGLLTIAFIVLKLCGVIDWSWWWVLAPTWIPISCLLIFVVIYVIVRRIRRRKGRL